MTLRPTLHIQDETELLEVFMDAMRHNITSVRLAHADFRQGNMVSIKRKKPIITKRGKHFPIRTINLRHK